MALQTGPGIRVARTKYKQQPPYKKALPYYLNVERFSSSTQGAPWGPSGTPAAGIWNWYFVSNPVPDRDLAAADVKAYDRFIEKMKSAGSSQVAANFAERKKSMSMVATRSLQLATVLLNLRHVRVGNALKLLGFKKVEKWGYVKGRRVITHQKVTDWTNSVRANARNAGSVFLELHFGWSPLVSDIYGAIQRLANSPSLSHVKVTGSSSASRTETSVVADSRYTTATVNQKFIKCAYHGHVRVTGDGGALLNDLGLVNPLSVAWEVIPFSWLVDWLLPVGAYINSLTDMIGYEVTNPCRGVWLQTKSKINEVVTPYGESLGIQSSSQSSEYIDFRRYVGFSSPTFKQRMKTGTGIGSVARAATAVSYLLTTLKQQKH